jgi:hypothetical protein
MKVPSWRGKVPNRANGSFCSEKAAVEGSHYCQKTLLEKVAKIKVLLESWKVTRSVFIGSVLQLCDRHPIRRIYSKTFVLNSGFNVCRNTGRCSLHSRVK